jgi:hypothetical protein
MKIDKETLIKQRFWVCLGVLGFVVFIVLIWLFTWVQSDLAEKKRKIDEHRQQLDANSKAHLKGKKEEEVLDNKIDKLTKRKNIVWDAAWDAQNPPKEGLIVWPAKVEKEYIDLNFGEQPNDFARHVGTYTGVESYARQYTDLGNTFRVEIPGAKPDAKITFDPVLFAGKRGWKDTLKWVESWKAGADVTAEEVWLAQEDYWVQRELMRALKQANYTVGHFTPVAGAKADSSKNELARQRFENPNWQLELALVRAEGKFLLTGKITNIGKRRQQLGKIYFWVRVHKDPTAAPVALEVQGEALGVGKEWPINPDQKVYLTGLFRNPEGVFDVEQIFDNSTSPIRRIDQVAMFMHSHRTFEPDLKRPSFSPPAVEKPKTPLEEDKDPLERTENGLVRTRYYDMTAQVRRLPLGLVMIVDQAHVPEIETALANCKLRFQTTQVNVQHFRGIVKPPEKEERAFAPKTESGEEAQNNLVEMSIFGIASLYERPPKKKEAAAAAAGKVGP